VLYPSMQMSANNIESTTFDLQKAPMEADISLFELRRLIWANKRYFLLAVITSVIAAFVFVALYPPKYVAKAYLIPNQGSEMANGQLAQFQQLAGLIGGQSAPGMAAVSELSAVMRSKAVAIKMINESDVLEKIYPGRWDKQNGRWRPVEGVSGAAARLIYSDLLGINLPNPGPDLLVDHIQRKVELAAASKNPGLFEVQYEARTPEFALQFLSTLLEKSEAILVMRYSETNMKRLEFAQKQIAQDHPKEVKDAIQALLVSELRRSVNLSSGQLDTVRFVLSPEVSNIPKRPSLSLTLAMFVTTSVLMVLLFVVLFGRRATV
jgi:LPS O-antigen subunit length determinant protein (WzzB/FepE family)